VQLIGAFSVRAAEIMALALAKMGIDRAFVVHGADGLDEISITGPTTVFQVDENGVQKGRWQPADFGLPEATLEDLQGGDSKTNAEIIRALLEGETGPKRDIVIANAAAALFVARKALDLKSAVAMAIESIDSGAARRKLEKLIEFSARLQHVVAS
jgi:anthranilate phosphoribosyltransferase